MGVSIVNVEKGVLNIFTAANIPVHCVHDSFIVPYSVAGRLQRTMAAASRGVVGHALPFDATNTGLDEMTDWPRNVVLDHVTWRQTERCAGYLERQRALEVAQAGGRGGREG
jgi:hypothetical protein